jgi:uncharacterized protein YndB with AHSA1/START domain
VPIEFQHTIDVPQPPEKVFALLADVSQTPRWLARCTGIEMLTPPPLVAGSKLRYSYKEGGRIGVMEGEVTEFVDGRKLGFLYRDKMMRVGVHFAMEPSGAGTRLTHAIDITPQTFFAKLLSPLIRKQLPKQTITAMESLRTLLAQP